MKLSLILLMFGMTQAYAVNLLSYPVDQQPECNQSFELASKPETLDRVQVAMRQICLRKGGTKVEYLEKVLGDSNEPFNVLLSCIGENPTEYTVFTCEYSSRILGQ